MLVAGYTIGQKTRGSLFRSAGDDVSLLGADRKHQTTRHHSNAASTHKNAVLGHLNGSLLCGLIGAGKDALKSHNVSNIKDENIYTCNICLMKVYTFI